MYHITWTGNDQSLTLVDQLPSGLGTPTNIQINDDGIATYDEVNHQIHWSGAPLQERIVTLSYQATVQVNGPQILTNTANLSDASGLLINDSFNVYVDLLQIFLPLLSR